MAQSSLLGYPRIGRNRELKRAVERYWSGKNQEQDVVNTARDIRKAAWVIQDQHGIDQIPVNDFSYYDQVLDTICLTGLVPERYNFNADKVDIDTYFAMARGAKGQPALELTKWFDTNYHYLVPEFDAGSPRLASDKPFAEFEEAKKELGKTPKPVLVGPVTLLLLGKSHTKPLAEHLADLLPVYAEILSKLKDAGAEWVQIDEPTLVEDRTDDERALYQQAYAGLASQSNRPKIMLQTYFESLDNNWDTAVALPVEGLGLDFVRTDENRTALKQKGFPADKVLSAGVVNGRNVWRSNLNDKLALLEEIAETVDKDRIWVQPSSSLLHLPHDVELEEKLDQDVKNILAFAEQRLEEIRVLTKGLNEGRDAVKAELDANAKIFEQALKSTQIFDAKTQERVASVSEADFNRKSPFRDRIAKQKTVLNLPDYPTTTIGSFPQTKEVRSMRAKWKKGSISDQEYWDFMRERTKEVIKQQEDIGLDVLAHGEFERTDMVEFFAEKLDGMAVTENAWVQSYGSRCVRPPIVFGDVRRPQPMTVDMIAFAQQQTDKPMKGMLTGPVTILNWSFEREDIPPYQTANQIALALLDEVVDLQNAGIRVIQVDEPALREGLPLRERKRKDYLDWSVRSFRLATSTGVEDETQIHTHMCYAEFNEIIEAIEALDADVISVENSRSHAELLQAFTDHKYERHIGPGVYDVHSAQVPTTESMVEMLRRSSEVLPEEQIWVNPDCGLKTRGNEEVWPSLKNMVDAAKEIRARQPVGAD
jgi:5-methyltetrahydropteroyltriglutamate--homocysteine methyltransferase